MKLRWSSFRAALAGVVFLVRTERHARWHLLATVLVTVLGATLSLTRSEWLILILAMALVWVAEALNTAIEQVCDAVTEEPHPRIGHAKDVAAGAVLLAVIFAVVVGAAVFIPKLWPG
jgi:diacylglycerol kinase (ATP)